MRDIVRWGMIGCGDVTEVKSGPALQKATGSALAAVMRRDRAKAEDYARRHGVPRVHDRAESLINDPDVDAVYVATPPSSHRELALRVASARKPCLVEKPMAMTHTECLEMVEAFDRARVPLWVAYYRRALPRFLKVRDLVATGAIGRVTSVHVEVHTVLPAQAADIGWRVDPSIAGAGLLFDLASHCFDLLDFLIGHITAVTGHAINTGGVYSAEDVTAASFAFASNVVGTGIWNFNASTKIDHLRITGSQGELDEPGLQRYGRNGDDACRLDDVLGAQSAPPAPAARADDRGRARRPRTLRVHRRERRPNVLGDGAVRAGVLRKNKTGRMRSEFEAVWMAVEGITCRAGSTASSRRP